MPSKASTGPGVAHPVRPWTAGKGRYTVRVQDLRLAFRNLVKRPGLAATSIVTLALGIGANTAVFTIFNAVLLAPLPYERPEDVVILQEQTPQFPSVSVTRYNYEAWRERAHSFAGMAAFRPLNVTVTGAGDPERVPAKMITADLLPLLGVSIERGRGFNASDDRPGAEGVAILSAAFAERRFPGAEPLGRTLQLDNQPYTVVGIVPRRFEFFQPADIYVPFGPWAATLPEDRGWHPGIFPIARVKRGVSLEDARLEMDAIARQLEAQYPESNREVRVLVTPVQDLLVQNVRPALRMLLGAVVLVLLIACANVANLLLARGVGRRKEIALRFALGAGRGRIFRQLLIESVVLACVSGAAGLLVALWGVSLLSAANAAALPRAQNIGLAWPVAVFALGVSVLTGLVFGLVPAVQAMRSNVRHSLNEEGRGGFGGVQHRKMRGTLVVVEVGLALVLLVGAGLLLRSFSTLTQVPPGFNPENLLVVNLPLSPQKYADSSVRTAAVAGMLERVRELPGVRGAAITTGLPMAGEGVMIHFNRAAFPPKHPDDYVMTGLRAVTPGYFETIGVPLRRGRTLTEQDRQGAPLVAIINESMARQFFHEIDPIGQRIQLGTEPDSDLPAIEIVGVVGDVKQSFQMGSKAEMFVPYGQHPEPILVGIYLSTALVVGTKGDPAVVTPSVRAALRAVDPEQPLVNVRTMETAIDNTVVQPRLQTKLLILFAILAVTLAAVGVYSVMAYTVSQRIPEIGVRIALGASPNRVVGMLLWQGGRLALAGLGLGLVAAAFAGRAVESLLFRVHGLDPLTFSVAPAVVVIAAFTAAYVPARRAARISPLVAMSRLAP
jgi:putative ABC transport system permease protein